MKIVFIDHDNLKTLSDYFAQKFKASKTASNNHNSFLIGFRDIWDVLFIIHSSGSFKFIILKKGSQESTLRARENINV